MLRYTWTLFLCQHCFVCFQAYFILCSTHWSSAQGIGALCQRYKVHSLTGFLEPYVHLLQSAQPSHQHNRFCEHPQGGDFVIICHPKMGEFVIKYCNYCISQEIQYHVGYSLVKAAKLIITVLAMQSAVFMGHLLTCSMYDVYTHSSGEKVNGLFS